jgi:hypothetical protein
VLAARCSGLVASDSLPILLSGLGLAAASNLFSRRTLSYQLTRTVFHSRGEPGPFAGLNDLPTRHSTLTARNLASVLVASASVPLLVPGASVAEDPRGVYRDGALVDYHPVLDAAPPDLVLYPHFYGHFTPGWFDRSLPFRRSRAPILRRTVVLAPTDAFVASLPGGGVPTRRDVRRFGDDERTRRWREVWKRSRELGDALDELLASPGRVTDVMSPLP